MSGWATFATRAETSRRQMVRGANALLVFPLGSVVEYVKAAHPLLLLTRDNYIFTEPLGGFATQLPARFIGEPEA